jgi:hypothetical protein
MYSPDDCSKQHFHCQDLSWRFKVGELKDHLQIIRSKSETLQIRYKTVPIQYRAVRKAFHFTNVTDSFQIRLTFVTTEYASWEI